VVLALFARWTTGIWYWSFGDLAVYRTAGAAVLHDVSLYRPTTGLPFTYPPFSGLLFVPMHLIGSWPAALLLTAVSAASYIVVIVICARRLQFSPEAVVLAGVGFLVFEPVIRTFRLGQINLVLVALIVVDCFVVPRRYRGLLTGIAAGIKIVPGVFVLYFAIRREWDSMVRAAVGFGVSVGLSGLFIPRDTWTFWTKLFYDPGHVGGVAYVDNQSLFGVLTRLTRSEHPPVLISGALVLGALILSAIAAHRQLRHGDEVAALTCIGIGGLLASPISWSHHWIWLVPAVLVLMRRKQYVAAGLIGGISYLAPQWFTPAEGLREFHHNWWQASLCACMAGTGVLFLALMCRPIPARSADIAGIGAGTGVRS
jgi:alpha-1,2-mannosyltransferase